MLEIFFCKNCINQLIEYGYPTLEIYESLCEDFILDDFQPIFFDEMIYSKNKDPFLSIIKFLETKGFVMTTECGRTLLQVKPLGYRDFTGDHLFCIGNCEEWDDLIEEDHEE